VRLPFYSSDLRHTWLLKLNLAAAAGGSRLAEDLPEDLFGPTLAPQWIHDGKGAALLVSLVSVQPYLLPSFFFGSGRTLTCFHVCNRRREAVLRKQSLDRLRIDPGVVRMTKVGIAGRAAVEVCKD